MDVTNVSVIAANSFTNAEFVVVRLATTVQLAEVAVERLAIT